MAEGYQPPFSLFGEPPTPMFGSDPGHQYRGPFDLQTQNPMLNMAGQVFIPMMMQQFLGAKSGKTWGQFSPSQNLYDQMMAKNYFEQQQAAMNTAALRDQASYQATIQGGMMLATGGPLSLQQQQQAFGISKQVADMTPILAQVLGPDFVDMLHGSRGSSVVLSQALHRSLQTARDPVSGAIGVSGDSAGVIANEIYSRYFGPTSDMSAMKGLTAGQAGLLFEQMQQRGLMPPSAGQMSATARYADIAKMDMTDAQVARLAESSKTIQDIRRSGRTPTDHDFTVAEQQIRDTKGTIDADVAGGGPIDVAKLAELPGSQDMLRAGDAQRYAARLKNMAGAITAMRDIFGDMGRPNAPMRELVNGLEALTQGGLATMSPAELERIARTTQVLAKQSGVSVQAMLGLTAQAAQQGKQLGLDPVFAIQSTQAAVAFGAAARDTLRLDRPTYGALSLEELTLYDQQLRQNAIGSQTGNQIMATARMAEAGYFKPGTRAAKVAVTLAAGNVTYTDDAGKQQSAIMTPSEWRAMLEESDVAVGDADAFLQDTVGNQRLGTENTLLGRAARRAQRNTDIRPWLAQAVSQGNFRRLLDNQDITDIFKGIGATDVDMSNIMQRMGEDVAEGYLNLTPEEATSPELRRNAMAKQFQQTLTDAVTKASEEKGFTPAQTAAAVTGMLDKLGPADANGVRKGALRMAMTSEADMSSAATRNGYKLHGLWQLFNESTIEAGAAREKEAAATVMLQTATAGVATAGPMKRLVDALQSGKPLTLAELASKAIGGIDFSDIAKDSPQFQIFTEAMTRANDPTLRDAKGLTEAGWATKKRMAEIITAVVGDDNGASAAVEMEKLYQKYGVKSTEALENEIRRQQGVIVAEPGPDGAARAKALDWDLQLIPAFTEAQKGSMTARLRQAGISAGTKIDADYLRQAVNSGKSVEELRAAAAAEPDPTKKAALEAEAERTASTFMEQARTRLEALDLSPTDLEDLGAGAVSRVFASRQKVAELQLFADTAKVDVAKLLAGTDGTPEQQEEARKQAAAIGLDISGYVAQKAKGYTPTEKMTPAEKQAAEDLSKWRTEAVQRFKGEPGKFVQSELEAEEGVEALLKTLPPATQASVDRERLTESVARTGRGEGYWRIARSREELLKMAGTTASASPEEQENALATLRASTLPPEQEARLAQLEEEQAPYASLWLKPPATEDDGGYKRIHDTIGAALPAAPVATGQDKRVAVEAKGTMTLVGLDKVLMQMEMPNFDLNHMNIAHVPHVQPNLTS